VEFEIDVEEKKRVVFLCPNSVAKGKPSLLRRRHLVFFQAAEYNISNSYLFTGDFWNHRFWHRIANKKREEVASKDFEMRIVGSEGVSH
jgi:hypothetical protein